MNVRASGGPRVRRSASLASGVLFALVLFLGVVPSAFAGIGFGVTPTFPSMVSVGQTGISASLQITNTSTPMESTGNVTLNGINFVPACGTTFNIANGDCPAASADPGVFALSATGTGETGTACAGTVFTIAIISPSTGQVSFTPAGGSVVLTPPGTTNSICRIDFTFSVLKAPTKPASPSAPNTVNTGQIGFATGTSAVTGATGTGSGSDFVTVALGQPAIVTAATATNTLGTAITDTATLSAPSPPGVAPTGSITFTLFGPDNAACTGAPIFTSTVVVNAGVGNYTSAAFTPTAAGAYRWIASYTGDANYVAVVGTCNGNGETSTTVLPPPMIAVTKAVAPPSEVEPGGTFTYTVQVSNPSATTPVTITALNDNIYGDLSTRTGSTCGALIGTTLAPGATSPTCTFPGPFTGKAGDTLTDIVTVTGMNNGMTVTATATAMVTLTPAPPQIAVTKAAAPPSQPEPGGTFTFTVQVSNPSTLEPVTITTLNDNIYGDLATRAGSTCGTLIGTTLAPGASSPSCSFPGPFTGKAGDTQQDTVTVTGINRGTTVTATAMATVTLTPALTPQIAVTKAAAPPSLVEPGGTFTFTIRVSNPSTVNPVTITKLVDNVYGDLTTRAGSTCAGLIGVILAPGASSAPCSFTGPFTGKAGASQTDTVTVTGTNGGITVTATAMATVTLTPAGAQIAVTKKASPASKAAPGGTFTFTAQVSNPSTLQPVTITKLVDNVYGDLATRAGSTCGALIGVTLAPGATSAACSFPGTFSGSSGASQTDVITVTGTNAGMTVTATARATVTLTPPPAAKVAPASLRVPAACTAKPFKAYVSGASIAKVVYYLDGRRIGTISKRDSHGRISITINTAGLARGKVHHLTAVVEPVPHSGQPVRTVRRTFAVCAVPAVPRFTG